MVLAWLEIWGRHVSPRLSSTQSSFRFGNTLKDNDSDFFISHEKL